MAEERTVGQLVAEATKDISEIVRAEVALAKAELASSAKNGAVAGGLFGAAGYLAFLASILLVIAAAYGIAALGLAPGWAFLIVAGVLLLLAAILGLVGRGRISRVGPPTRAIESTKQTIAAVKPGATATGR
jgi:membrane protein implicated in regulation of membrane protease activity